MADKEKYVPIVRVKPQRVKAEPKPSANKSAQEYASLRAKKAEADNEMQILLDSIALEARGEGIEGMALVARSILNRKKYLDEKKDWEGVPVYKNAYLTKGKTDLLSILRAPGQYAVIDPKTKMPDYEGQKKNPLLDRDRMSAAVALGIARDDEVFGKFIAERGIPELAKYATGFRTRTAKDDPSQNVGNFTYKNHVFNTATGTAKPKKK
jgi:hypothetical protein